MLATLYALIPLAAEETGNGRGVDADGGSGVLIIVAICVAVILIAAAGVTFILRSRGGSVGKSPAMDKTEHRPGGVGRSS